MHRSSQKQTALPAAWGEVLEQVQQALTLAETDCAKRQSGAEATGPYALPTAPSEIAQSCQARIAERMQKWEAGLKELESRIHEVDETLKSSEGLLQNWLDQSAQLRPSKSQPA